LLNAWELAFFTFDKSKSMAKGRPYEAYW